MTFNELCNIVQKYAELYNVDPFLILGIIYTESSGNPDAESFMRDENGNKKIIARGLMQLTPIAIKEVNNVYNRYFIFDDMLKPESNIECGILLFKRYCDYWKRNADEKIALQLALLSYAWGITAVINWLKDTKPDNGFIDEAIPQEKTYYNESVTFWYMKVKAVYTELQKNMKRGESE